MAKGAFGDDPNIGNEAGHTVYPKWSSDGKQLCGSKDEYEKYEKEHSQKKPEGWGGKEK